jgi:transketolase
MLASRMHMHHLHAIVDCNGHQEYGWPQEEPLPAARAKWEAFGWNVFTADGHNHSELQRTLQAMRKTADSPSVCLARTIKGYGFEAIVADPARFHCTTVTPDEHRQFIGGSNC